MFDAIYCVPKIGEESSNVVKAAIEILHQFAENTGTDILHVDPLVPLGEHTLYHTRPLYVALGGDGTMLAVMRMAGFYGGDVLGVNFGKLGFLTNPTELKDIYDALEELFSDCSDNWKPDMRMLARVVSRTTRKRKINWETIAANEVLLTTPTRRSPVTYEIYIGDGSPVATQTGDGVIVATATGSTGYALSAGGTILAPSIQALQIVPLAAHTLTSRPIVVGSDSNVFLRARVNDRIKEISVFADGIKQFTIDDDVSINVQPCKFVNLWRPYTWNFAKVLREKLKWNV